MKTNAIIRIVVFSLAILVLVSILLGVLAYDGYTFSTRSINATDSLERIDMHNVTADIQNIEIEWVAGSITIQRDQYTTDITVNEFSPADSEYEMVLKQSGQTLKIKYSDQNTIKFPSFGVDVDISKDLVITVPMDWECGSLEIDTAAAEVVINDLTIDEFDFDGASGVCEMYNCNIREMDIDTASGDVHFSGTLQMLDCDAASADCYIEVTNIPQSIKMDGMSGDLELIMPPNAGFTCTLDTMSGDFESDFEFYKHGFAYIYGDGACEIKVSAMSGDVSILKGVTVPEQAASNQSNNQ